DRHLGPVGGGEARIVVDVHLLHRHATGETRRTHHPIHHGPHTMAQVALGTAVQRDPDHPPLPRLVDTLGTVKYRRWLRAASPSRTRSWLTLSSAPEESSIASLPESCSASSGSRGTWVRPSSSTKCF